MKTSFAVMSAVAAVGLACGTEGGDGGAVVLEADARTVAAKAVDGMALSASLDDDSDPPRWEVDVEMDNGGSIEAKVHADTADLLGLAAFSGPFDYDFTPLDGVQSFASLKSVALNKVPGEVEGWKFDHQIDEDKQAFGFLIRDSRGEQWEIELDAMSGKPASVEGKDGVDE